MPIFINPPAIVIKAEHPKTLTNAQRSNSNGFGIRKPPSGGIVATNMMDEEPERAPIKSSRELIERRGLRRSVSAPRSVKAETPEKILYTSKTALATAREMLDEFDNLTPADREALDVLIKKYEANIAEIKAQTSS